MSNSLMASAMLCALAKFKSEEDLIEEVMTRIKEYRSLILSGKAKKDPAVDTAIDSLRFAMFAFIIKSTYSDPMEFLTDTQNMNDLQRLIKPNIS